MGVPLEILTQRTDNRGAGLDSDPVVESSQEKSMVNNKQMYRIEVSGQPPVELEVIDLRELRTALVRAGLALPKARALVATIWGERGGVVQGQGYRVVHLGSMRFVPVEAPAVTAAKPHSKPEVGTSVLKPRAVRPAPLAEPASEGKPFSRTVDDLEVQRLFDSLEGEP